MPGTSLPAERVQTFHSVLQVQHHPTVKCLKKSLQTETRLMLDTVLKEHQDGMYLKISERIQVTFNAQGHFTIIN